MWKVQRPMRAFVFVTVVHARGSVRTPRERGRAAPLQPLSSHFLTSLCYFLDDSVSHLSQQQKVLSVHVSLSSARSDLLSSRCFWTVLPSTLASLSGGSWRSFGINTVFSFARNRDIRDCFSDLNSLLPWNYISRSFVLMLLFHF